MNQEKNRSRRRRSKGTAWHWQQTDAWYYTPPGTKQRMPLFDVSGQRIRGKDKKPVADLALARLKVNGKWKPTPAPSHQSEWLVARVCSEYLQYCERGVANGAISSGHHAAIRCLNDLSGYCGALPVSQLSKEHVRFWIDSHASWRSPATVRNAIAIVLAAFNLAKDSHDIHVVGNLAALGLNSEGERGVLGIAFDPDYATNRFVYIYYTSTDAPNPHNRISRFTVDDSNGGDYFFEGTTSGGEAGVPTETIIFELDPLSGATNHNGGAIHFGLDGMLYVAVGDNADGANAELLDNLHGKMLWINRDGTIPGDNPFIGQTTGSN